MWCLPALFAEMLEESVRKYQNRAIETAEIIQELIRIAKDLREAGKRGERKWASMTMKSPSMMLWPIMAAQ